MITYYKLIISETSETKPGAANLGFFNEDISSHKTLQDVKKYMFDRYGKHIKPRRKIFIDSESGTKQVGWLYSFWNKDWSHNTKSWFQTDWLEVRKVNEETVIL